ncbi:hypothetical protein LI90_872 [Carbonactinospora thermoautotrophica]|uniref:Tox-PL domain-containing protein n=2 Tax=Carbonactinospora thermoautotrophica TaxID=1469144 RepID=A0A132MN08_9ACTN|nr:hypothetical protein LI90_872 [Carbonactinospora thermoautotrophica]
MREYAHQYLQPHQQGDVYAHAPVLWDIANGDVGRLMKDEDPRAQVSALTGSDVPPPADTTRPYDQPGGLRRPLLQHQEDLELLLPRNLDGSFQRMPDLLLPSGEVAPWVRAINDGGPQADPTRGQNCVDCTLSFRETWGHARARVAAPRTFDGYANGDVNQVLFGELDGTGRTEDVTGGRYQGLTGDLRNVPPDQARQAVQDAYDAIAKKLLDSGSGAHAFIVTDWAGQGAHQWMAVNQNGKILWVDPQIGLAQDTPPYHYSEEGGQPGDVVGVHALVCGEDFAPTPLDGYPLSVYSNRPPTPEYLEAQQRTAQQETKPQPPHQAGSQQPDEAETPSGPLPGHASGQYWPQQPWAPYPQHQQPIAQFPQQAGQPAPPLPHATPAQSAPQQGWPPRPHAQQPVPQQHTQYAQYGHQPPVPSQHQAQPGPWQYGQQHAQAGPHSHPPQPVPHQVPWPGPHQPWPQSHAGTPQHGQPVPQHWQQLAPQRSHAPVPPQPGPQLVPHQYLQQPAPHQAVPQHWQQPLSPRTDQRAYPHAPAPPQPAPEAGPRQAQHPAPPHHGWAPPDAAPSDAPSAHPRPEEQAVQRDFQARYEPPAPPVHPQPAPEQPASDQAPPTDRTAEGGEPDVESFYLPVRDIELIRLLKDDRAIKGLFENGLEGLLKNLSEDKQREILSGLRTSWHEAETLIKKTYRDLAYVMVIQAPRNSEMAQALRALVEGRLPGGDPGFASAIKGESLRRVIRLERDYDTEHPPLREPRPTYGKKKRWLAEEDEPVKPNEPEYEYQHYTRKSYENPNFSLEQAKAEQPRAPHADGSASASQPPEPVSLARPRPSTDQRAHPAPAGAPTPTAFRGGPETPGSDRDSSRLEHHQTRSALAAPSHGHPPAPGSPPPPGSMPPPGSAVPPGGETPSSQSPVPKPENFSPELSGAFDRLPPKAQEQLVQLFERNGGRSVGVQRRLEGMAKGILGHAVPLGQIPTDTLVEILEQSAARDKANQPIPLSPDRAADRPLLEKVTDLQRQSERAWELWKEFEERHPGIPGTNDWARRLREQDKAIDEMRRDRREATAEKINGTRGNIAGIHAEIEAALKIPRLPADQLRELASRELRISEVSKKLRFGKFRSDADVIFVDESGRPIWVDTKDYPPFSSKSERWEKLGKQVENQIEIAKAEAVAGRRLPEVAFYFPKGVDPSVCQKLQEKGVIVIGEFRFYRGDGPGSEGGEME